MRSFFWLLIFAADWCFSQEIIPVLDNQLINFPNVRDFTISKSQNEAYFSGQSILGEVSVIFVSKKGKKKWSTPEIAPFSGQHMDLEPFLSPDGLKLYFASNRSRGDNQESKDFDIWYVTRKSIADSWSSPINLGPPVNTSQNEFFPSVTLNGNLYFTSDQPGTKGNDDIFISRFEDGAYHEPYALSDSINSEGFEFNAFIAPDESFMLYTAYDREDGHGSGDLYISYRNGLNWSQSKNLGSFINSTQMDYCPFYDVVTRTLYFTSRRSKVSGGFSTLNQFFEAVNENENGMSRIYQALDFELPTSE